MLTVVILFHSDEAAAYQERLGVNSLGSEELYRTTRLTDRKVDLMHWFDDMGRAVREETSDGPYLPMWQTSPFLNASGLVNYNMIHKPDMSQIAANVIETKTAFFG